MLNTFLTRNKTVNTGIGKKKKRIKRFIQQRWLIAMIVPAFLILFIFHYIPIYGIVIAFKNYRAPLGIWGSKWVGFKYFIQFFQNPFHWRVLRNTVLLGLYSFLWGFPAPIILSLLLNEVKHARYKRFVQTISYLPYFISVVIIVGIMKEMLAMDGIINNTIAALGGERIGFFIEPKYFRSLYVISGIWQGLGWGTIIYLAALAGVDVELYESAIIDGANRWHQMWHITLPSIMPTIVVLMILNVRGILGSDTQKILLMYNPSTYETADTIQTYVFREGIEGAQYSYSTAVGLLMSVISFIILYITNKIAQKTSDYSLW
ncbi:MAG TPA: sugar ABC transporter permease [Clostridiales bacterium]|nr:sugar ABC transporter permease [Clostridiales bacterium]